MNNWIDFSLCVHAYVMFLGMWFTRDPLFSFAYGNTILGVRIILVNETNNIHQTIQQYQQTNQYYSNNVFNVINYYHSIRFVCVVFNIDHMLPCYQIN
jgi:hypothetical protein